MEEKRRSDKPDRLSRHCFGRLHFATATHGSALSRSALYLVGTKLKPSLTRCYDDDHNDKDIAIE